MNNNNNLNDDKIYMTKEGIKDLENKLNILVNETRPAVLIDLSEARKQGDLSENADYDAARERQAEVESEILKIETILSKSEEIKHINNKIVEISNIVKFENIDTGKIIEIKLVSSNIEIEPFNEKVLSIAIDSPIGKAMMSKKVNDEVLIETSSKNFRIRILKIT